MTEKAQAFVDSLSLDYSAEFVPLSKSRNADGKYPTINWRITLGGRLAFDYSEGCAHLPNYSHPFSRLAVCDAAVREACETGQSTLIKHKNGYDAAQGRRRKRKLEPPKLVNVIYCLIADSNVLDYATFEEWASEYGYDTDSRKAETVYRECLQQTLALRQLIDLDAAREAFADY